MLRGTIAEVGAQALLPWILWAARRLMMGADRPAVSAATLAALLGALAVTRTVTLILFPPLLAGYLLVLWWQQGRSASRLGWALAALGEAMGLSAFSGSPFWQRVGSCARMPSPHGSRCSFQKICGTGTQSSI
jgi:hypothetical protein